jgi:hypothetical protein
LSIIPTVIPTPITSLLNTPNNELPSHPYDPIKPVALDSSPPSFSDPKPSNRPLETPRKYFTLIKRRTKGVYYVDSKAHIYYTNVKVVMYNSKGEAFKGYLDTGTRISLIIKAILRTFYLNAILRKGPRAINLSSIGSRLIIDNFV